MPWTCLDVQGTQQSTANTIQLAAFAVTVNAGDAIFVGCSNWNSVTRAIITPTDTAGGNTYTAFSAQLAMNTNAQCRAYFCIVTNGGATFRVTVESTVSTAELTGVAWLWRHSAGTPASNADAKTATGTSTNPATGTSTPSPAAGGVFVGFMSNLGTQTITDGSGFNAIADGFDSGMLGRARQTDNATHQDLYGEYKLSDSALSMTWGSTSDTWAAMVASVSKADSGVAFLARKNPPIRQAVHRSNSW